MDIFVDFLAIPGKQDKVLLSFTRTFDVEYSNAQPPSTSQAFDKFVKLCFECSNARMLSGNALDPEFPASITGVK